MPVMSKLPDDHPLMIAWTAYQKTDDFKNVLRWNGGVGIGNLWACFMAGYFAATDRAANLHESVDPASDDERINKHPGAGAMGAVIEYRDLIRETA